MSQVQKTYFIILQTNLKIQQALTTVIVIIPSSLMSYVPPPSRAHAINRRGKVPMLILWGEKDPLTPLYGSAGRFISDFVGVKGAADGGASRLEVLSTVGHCPHDDDPAEVNGRVLRWLTERTVR